MFVVNQLKKVIEIFGSNTHEHYVLAKKGSFVNTFNIHIKVIEYEEHGQPLINKLTELKPIQQTTSQAITQTY